MLIVCEKIPIFDKINEKLFVGDIVAAENRDLLKDNDVKCIICLTDEKYKRFEDFEYHDFHIEDNRNVDISTLFEKTNRILDENTRNGKVFVHCQNGVSRSVTIVLAYFIYTGICLKTALEIVKKNRNTYSRPNSGFAKQLLKYERELLGTNSITFTELHS